MKLVDLPDASAEPPADGAADPVDEAAEEQAGGSEAGGDVDDAAQEQVGGEDE